VSYREIQLIDGVQCSELGIPLAMGIRCPHLVVDGDKPLDPISGPRCGECRKRWEPFTGERGYSCPQCHAPLHTTHAYREDVDGYPAICWSHNAPNGWCRLLTYPVEGNERYYLGAHGWGRWEEYAEDLRRRNTESIEFEAHLQSYRTAA